MPGLCIVETRQQARERGLAATGASDQRGDAACGTLQIERMQRRNAGLRIGEFDALERDLAARARDALGSAVASASIRAKISRAATTPRCRFDCTVVRRLSDGSITSIAVISDMKLPGLIMVSVPGRVARKITSASAQAATSCTSAVDSALVEATLRFRLRIAAFTALKRSRS